MTGRLRSFAGSLLGSLLLLLSAAVVFSDEALSRDEGKRLYQKSCSGCHGDLENSAKGGRSMNRILTAVRTLHQHKQLSSLTDSEVLLIALVLKDISY